MFDRGIRSRGGTYASRCLFRFRKCIVNPNAEVVVIPRCTLIGKLVPVAAISVAMAEMILPIDGLAALPEYLVEIGGGGALTRRWVTNCVVVGPLYRYKYIDRDGRYMYIRVSPVY